MRPERKTALLEIACRQAFAVRLLGVILLGVCPLPGRVFAHGATQRKQDMFPASAGQRTGSNSRQAHWLRGSAAAEIVFYKVSTHLA